MSGPAAPDAPCLHLSQLCYDLLEKMGGGFEQDKIEDAKSFEQIHSENLVTVAKKMDRSTSIRERIVNARVDQAVRSCLLFELSGS